MTPGISTRTPQQALAALLDRYAPQRLLVVGAGSFPALAAFEAAHPEAKVARAAPGEDPERVLGRARFLAVYVVSALTASALVMWLAPPTTTTLGASGAISGLMGALLVLVLRHKGDARTVLTWIGINVVITVLGSAGISWQGHLGGFLGGIAVTLLLVWLRKARPWQWMAVGSVGALALVAMAARVLAG